MYYVLYSPKPVRRSIFSSKVWAKGMKKMIYRKESASKTLNSQHSLKSPRWAEVLLRNRVQVSVNPLFKIHSWQFSFSIFRNLPHQIHNLENTLCFTRLCSDRKDCRQRWWWWQFYNRRSATSRHNIKILLRNLTAEIRNQTEAPPRASIQTVRQVLRQQWHSGVAVDLIYDPKVPVSA